MVSRDFEALSERRIARAQQLKTRFPASHQVFSFFAAVVALQKQLASHLEGWESLVDLGEPLINLVKDQGPPRLQAAAIEINRGSLQAALSHYRDQTDTSSPVSFFARVLLQPYLAIQGGEAGPFEGSGCPSCGHRPQVGVLRPKGDGMALSLVCSLCPRQWPAHRGRCLSCNEVKERRLSYYQTPGFDYFRVQVCESCRVYFHSIDLSQEPEAIPEVDELAALPLDVWAQQQGYRKLQANLAGI